MTSTEKSAIKSFIELIMFSYNELSTDEQSTDEQSTDELSSSYLSMPIQSGIYWNKISEVRLYLLANILNG